MQYVNGINFVNNYSWVHSSHMNIAEQIDRAMKSRKPTEWSQAELSRVSGVPQPTISRTLKGVSVPETETLSRLAKALNITFDHVSSNASNAQEMDLEDNPEFPSIKKVKLRVSAGITGFGVEPCTSDDSLIVFRSDWYHSRKLKPENLLALKVTGTSMEPNLYDGDVVVMNRADTDLKDGEVFVFNLDGEVVIKRAVRDQGQWWLDSDNQDKTRFTRKACPDGICIALGKVIHRQTEII